MSHPKAFRFESIASAIFVLTLQQITKIQADLLAQFEQKIALLIESQDDFELR